MVQKTFILNKKKTFRRGVRAFVKDINGKMEMRVCKFTTEHIVSPKERKKRARTISAEFTTSEPELIEALMRDSAYGKDFTLKEDPEGKLKEKTIVVTETDARRIALESLCREAGVEFDDNAPLDVLSEKYKMHVSALAGKTIEGSGPKSINIEKVDVKKNIEDTAAAARTIYEEKYGEAVPEIVSNDLAFLSALGDPGFDAVKYIENKLSELEAKEELDQNPPEEKNEWTVEYAREKYQEAYGANVPIPMKNNIAWMKKKIEEK